MAWHRWKRIDGCWSVVAEKRWCRKESSCVDGQARGVRSRAGHVTLLAHVNVMGAPIIPR